NDDETFDALFADAVEFFAPLLPGWVQSDGALEVALLSAVSDESSTLYALLRDDADDKYRDFGEAILGIPPSDPQPATTTITVTAAAPAPAGGWLLPAGAQMALTGPSGQFGFEVLEDRLLAAGGTTLTDVQIQALEEGAASNLATDPATLVDPQGDLIAWLVGGTVTVNAP